MSLPYANTAPRATAQRLTAHLDAGIRTRTLERQEMSTGRVRFVALAMIGISAMLGLMINATWAQAPAASAGEPRRTVSIR